MKRIKAIVSGRVQGVWFRAHTRDKARELGVRGYVRNLRSGDVELVAQGDDDAVETLLEWARIGPPTAAVSDVRVSEVENGENFDNFEVRY